MSQRTIIEINHDYGHEIINDPVGFMAVLQAMIRGGSEPSTVSRLKHYGVTHVGQRHHSDRCTVQYPHSKVEL